MKIRFFLIVLLGVGIYILNSGAKLGAANIINVGYTGAPGDNAGCSVTGCHTDMNPFGSSVGIEVFAVGTTTPVTSYVPGDTYEIKVTVGTTTPASGYGFQLICLNDQGNSVAGDLSNPGAGVRLSTVTTTGRMYAEHSDRNTDNTFSVGWTAPGPSSSTGSVTIYATGNAVNGNNNKSGDDAGIASLTIPEQSLGLFENDRLALYLGFYPNPSSENLNITFTGALSGDYNLEIFDELGRKVASEIVFLTSGENNHQLDVCDYVPSTYTLRLHKDGKYKTARFVKI